MAFAPFTFKLLSFGGSRKLFNPKFMFTRCFAKWSLELKVGCEMIGYEKRSDQSVDTEKLKEKIGSLIEMLAVREKFDDIRKFREKIESMGYSHILEESGGGGGVGWSGDVKEKLEKCEDEDQRGELLHSLARSYGEEGNLVEGLKILMREMPKVGITPSSSLFIPFILEGGEEVLEIVRKSKLLKVDEDMWSALIEYQMKAGEWKKVMAVFRLMASLDGLEGGIKTLNSCIRFSNHPFVRGRHNRQLFRVWVYESFRKLMGDVWKEGEVPKDDIHFFMTKMILMLALDFRFKTSLQMVSDALDMDLGKHLSRHLITSSMGEFIKRKQSIGIISFLHKKRHPDTLMMLYQLFSIYHQSGKDLERSFPLLDIMIEKKLILPHKAARFILTTLSDLPLETILGYWSRINQLVAPPMSQSLLWVILCNLMRCKEGGVEEAKKIAKEDQRVGKVIIWSLGCHLKDIEWTKEVFEERGWEFMEEEVDKEGSEEEDESSLKNGREPNQQEDKEEWKIKSENLHFPKAVVKVWDKKPMDYSEFNENESLWEVERGMFEEIVEREVEFQKEEEVEEIGKEFGIFKKLEVDKANKDLLEKQTIKGVLDPIMAHLSILEGSKKRKKGEKVNLIIQSLKENQHNGTIETLCQTIGIEIKN